MTKSWTVDDVMTRAVVSVSESASYRSLVDLLISRRFSAVPVVDDFQRVIGVVSETDLLRKIEYAGDEEPRLFEGRRRRGERAKALGGTAIDLMSSPPVVTLGVTPIAAAARLMDAEGVKRLPVVDDIGRLVGVVTRGDLLRVHLRPDDEIRSDVVDGVRSALAGGSNPAVEVKVVDGVVTLDGRVDRWSAGDTAARFARQVPGVVGVENNVQFDYDDRQILTPGTIVGVA